MLSDSKPLFLEIQENQRDPKGLGVIERDRKRLSRMIVSKYDCARPQLESTLDDFSRVDRRMVDGAALVQFIGYQVVAFVQEQHPELLAWLERHDGPQVIEDCWP